MVRGAATCGKVTSCKKCAVEVRTVLGKGGKAVANEVFALAFLPTALYELANNVVEIGICVWQTHLLL